MKSWLQGVQVSRCDMPATPISCTIPKAYTGIPILGQSLGLWSRIAAIRALSPLSGSQTAVPNLGLNLPVFAMLANVRLVCLGKFSRGTEKGPLRLCGGRCTRSPQLREEAGRAQDKSATAHPTVAQDCERKRKFRVPRFVA